MLEKYSIKKSQLNQIQTILKALDINTTIVGQHGVEIKIEVNQV